MEKNFPENFPPEEGPAVRSEMAEPEAPPPLQPISPSPSSSTSPLVIGAALVVAFAVGLFLGLLGRPLIIQDVPVQVVVTVVPDSNSQAVAQTEPEEPAESAEDGPAVPDPNATATPTLMEFVMADVRHIQGDEAAPITLVEFSDFK